ncbi:MAG TPA: acetoacetate--CoA ligase [Polyangiaceae bacterium]|jgi:acetoacetyl-CoA synthetase|nr:acetoacetate--CoA ligase [Polyangiaceae bacterium]
MATAQGTLLWTPPPDAIETTAMGRYMRWLEREEGLHFADYAALQAWSIRELPRFWSTLARYFAVDFKSPPREALGDPAMPGARFFPGATLNFAEHALRAGAGRGADLAVIARCETDPPVTLTWDDLSAAVARARAGLVRLGVRMGDAVAALLPNGVEALVCFLAAASLGATWTSCSPEFGVEAVLDRFRQVGPRVLIAVDGYRYGGRSFDRRAELTRVAASLPSLVATVVVPRLGEAPPSPAIGYAALCAESAPLAFAACPFDHPLWVLFSSGTTGLPKGIVQGHGGILLEHLKAVALHGDIGPRSRFFWFSTTSWMMWNYLVGGLLAGAAISLYEGHPSYPDPEALFRYAAADRLTDFGTSAPFLLACEKRGISPRATCDLSALRSVGSTGAPLPASGFGWVYEHVKPDVLLASVSGGTDVCTAFLLGCPLLPVHAGEIQCVGLGVAAQAFDDEARPVIGEVGELVITEPMPSMPLYFVGDPTGERLRASYFAEYPGIWRHGDFVEITPRGSVIVYGRSDATLNRGGVRMGSAEFYRVIEALPEVADSLVVDTGALAREDKLWLFVVLAPGHALDDALVRRIREAVRSGLSPRHVPDAVLAVGEIPRTQNGKKLEVPVKRLLMGVPRERAVQPGTLANEAALDALIAAAQRTQRT